LNKKKNNNITTKQKLNHSNFELYGLRARRYVKRSFTRGQHFRGRFKSNILPIAYLQNFPLGHVKGVRNV
jgi:hypothetical protein